MKAETIQIAAQLQWKVTSMEKRGYVAACDEIGLTMQGDNLDDLAAGINEALQLFFLDLLEEGEFHSFLTRKGWQSHSAEAMQKGVLFQVPYSLLLNDVGTSGTFREAA